MAGATVADTIKLITCSILPKVPMKTVKIDEMKSKYVQKKRILFNVGLFLFLLAAVGIISKYGKRLSMENSMYLIFCCAVLFPVVLLFKMILFRKN